MTDAGSAQQLLGIRPSLHVFAHGNFLLYIQAPDHRGIVLVAVHQQRTFSGLCAGDCQIHGDGRLALAGDRTGNHENLLVLRTHLLGHMHLQKAHRLRKAEFSVIMVDQRAALVLAHDLCGRNDAKAGKVQRALELVLIVDGSADKCQKQHEQRPYQQSGSSTDHK